MKPLIVLIMLVGVIVGQHVLPSNIFRSAASIPSRTNQLGIQSHYGHRLSRPLQNPQQIWSSSRQESWQMPNPRWTGPVVFPPGHEGMYQPRPAPQVTERAEEEQSPVPQEWVISSIPGPSNWPHTRSSHDYIQHIQTDRTSHLSALIHVEPQG